MDVMASSIDTSVLKPVQNNVNSSSSSSSATTKRLTMVEKARLEALAAFGNNGLDTLSFKKTDLRSKLKCTTINTENKPENLRPLTRMEKSRIEANNAFKNVQLGQLINNPRKRKIQHPNEGENLKKEKQISLTRIQKAKQEAEKAFENVSLDKIPPKRSKLEKEKMEKKLLEGKKESMKSEVKKIIKSKSSQPGSKPVMKSSRKPDKVPEVRSVGINTPKRLTGSESAKIDEGFDCVNGARAEASGDDIMSKKNVERKLTKNDEEKSLNSHGVAMETTHDDVSNFTSQSYQHNNINNGAAAGNGQKRLTRLERAKLEALQSFKGQEFSDICKQSMRIVAKHLRPKKDQACNTENEKLRDTPEHASEIFENEQESFHSKDAQLKGSETPKTNPTTHQQLKQKRPKVDVYSSIIEDNFKDQSSLLETSRRVVKTATELETPEGSPMSTIPLYNAHR